MRLARCRTLLLALIIPCAALADTLPRIAVGGTLRMGFGGVLLRAGLPFTYLTDREQADPAALAQYDVILQAAMFSDDQGLRGPTCAALDSFVKQGGMLWTAQQCLPPQALAGLTYSQQATGHPPPCTGWPFRLEAGDHPLLKRFAPNQQWEYGYHRFAIRPADQDTVLARFVDLPRFAALVSRKYGQGEVLYSGFDLAYLQGNWAPWYRDFILGVVDYLSHGKATPQWSLGRAPDAPVDIVETKPLPEPADQLVLANPIQPDSLARLPVPAEGHGVLQISGGPQRPGLLTIDVSAGQAVLESRRGRQELRLPASANEVIWHVLPERSDIVAGGQVLASLDGKFGGVASWTGTGEPVWQACEDGLFGADFMSEDGPSSSWTAVDGEWQTTGNRLDGRRPPFTLMGRDGTIAAGLWFWSGPRVTVAVRPHEAQAIRVQLCRDEQGNALEAELAVGEGSTRLLRRLGGQETVLATIDRRLPEDQWTQVELRADWRLAKLLVDGQTWLDATDPGPQFGAMALGVQGRAYFDDVKLSCGADTWPAPAVHSAAFDKGPEGLLDRDTWSHPAAAWIPTQERGDFWHVGRFPEDLWMEIRPSKWGPHGKVVVHAGTERGEPSPIVVADQPTDAVIVRRIAGEWSVSPGKPLAQPNGAVCLGLEFQDLDLAAEDVVLHADGVNETTFDKATVDWREAEGDWKVESRWTCDPRWAWLAGEGIKGRATLWQKQPIVGDLVVQTLVGVMMTGHYGSEAVEPVERLRVSVCGDGEDPLSGYTVEVGDHGPDVRLLRLGKEVARTKDVVPHWRETHNFWGDVRVERQGATLACWFHGRSVLTWTDPDPLGDGQVAVWTERNAMVVPYLAVYGKRGSP